MEPSRLVDGWALTLCLCSYDARFSSSAQVVAVPGVLRFGHRVGVCLLWGAPIVDTPPPCCHSHPPCLMGVPLSSRGVGCSLWPRVLLPHPLFVVAYPTVCVHPLGLPHVCMPTYTIAMSTAEITAYRIQSASRPVETLLDPEQQYSFPMDQDDEMVRHGVSGCATLADLAAYIACYAIEAPAPVLVRITGPASEDTPCDEEDGEVLVLPTSAEVVEDDEAFFELVGDLVDAHYEQGLDCEALREVAAERI